MKLVAFITHIWRIFSEPLTLSLVLFVVFCFLLKLGKLEFSSTFFFPSLRVSHVFSSMLYIYVLVFSGSHWKQKLIPNITMMKKTTWTVYLSGGLECLNDLCNTVTIHSAFDCIVWCLQTLDIFFFISKHFESRLKDISLSFITVFHLLKFCLYPRFLGTFLYQLR